MVTSGLAQDLCEQLRLILEPSQASRLKVPFKSDEKAVLNVFIAVFMVLTIVGVG